MALSVDYYVDSSVRDNSISREMDDRYQQFIQPNMMFWREASIDTRFKAGDQRIYADLYGGSLNRRQFFFNKTMRISNMICGYQRQNRKSTLITGIESADDATASQHSKSLFWAQKRANVDNIFSRAFENGSVTTGLNLIGVRMDFSSDPVSGDIVASNVGYSSFLIDPNFRSHDLSDCQCIWRRMWATPSQAKRILPGREKEISRMAPIGNKDNKFPYQAQCYNVALDKLFPIDEYYYMDSREQLIIRDLETGEVIEWLGDEDDEQLGQFLRMYPQVVKQKTWVPSVKEAIRINGRLLYEGPTSLGIDPYPFVPLLGYYEPDMPYLSNRLQGVLRGLRDAQYLYNRRKVIELDILESQVNSGYKYKIDALVDPNDVYLSGQGKGIALQPSAQMTDVEKILPADIPQSMIALSDQLGKELMDISGVNEELLGTATDDKAGILEMVRQGAGLITLQKLFDQADESQKLLGSIFFQAIQKNFKPSKIKRIIGEDPTPQFYNHSFGKYDCEIVEGVNTPTQRQVALRQALHLLELGIPVPPDYLLDLATVQDKEKLKAQIEQAQQQQAQQAQQAHEMQMAVLKAQAENYEAQSIAASGYGLEHLSRVRKNEAETAKVKAQTVEALEQSRLDKAKAIKELAEMDLNEIQQLLTLYQSLQDQQQVKAQVEQITDTKGASV